jgi:Uma2 family endonuclease
MYHDECELHIAAILDSPSAPSITARLQTAMEAEKQRRQQFYQDIDDDMKVEFINGEVIVHSPVKIEHTKATGFLYKILDTFVQIGELGFVGYEKVMSAFTRNDYEPDVVFFSNEKSNVFQKGQWKYPVPDFVVEVLSEGTEHRDRGIKFKDFESHGVLEYWIIDPNDETVEQYFLQKGKLKLHLKIDQGIIKSNVVKGFDIDVRAIFDEKVNLKVLWEIMSASFLKK